jgi:hypothetical protein
MARWTIEPGHQIPTRGPIIERHGVAVEEVWHDDEVAIGGELVGDELGVDEAVAEYVG